MRRFYSLVPGIAFVIASIAHGQSVPGRVQRPPVDKDSGDLAKERQSALDTAIGQLDEKLAHTGPCRFGELDQIFGEVEESKRQAVDAWGRYYDELIKAVERQIEGDTAALTALPGIIAKRETERLQVEEEIRTVNSRLAALPESDNASLKEARAALKSRNASLDLEIDEVKDVISKLHAEQSLDTNVQIQHDAMRGLYRSLLRRKGLIADKYDSLIRSKRRIKEAACHLDAPKQ